METSESEKIDRREALRRASLLMGGAFLLPGMMSFLKGCSPAGPDWKPLILNKSQVLFTEQLAETLLPETDTPGAIEAGVPYFIDRMVAELYTAEQQTEFLDGLDAFVSVVEQDNGRPFEKLDEQQRLTYITEINQKAIQEPSDETSFFINFKRLAIFGFCTSEPGVTQQLRYMKSYGDYKGCIPFEEVGRTWAVY